MELDPEPRKLAFMLGLGDLNHTPCHGYANACVCLECVERQRVGRRRKRRVALPWEQDAA